MSMNFAATSVAPIAAPLSPSHKQVASTPMPPPPPDPAPAKPLVSEAKPALARDALSPGVFFEPSASPSLATYSVPPGARTAFPQIGAADAPAISSSPNSPGAVYEMVGGFLA